MRYVMADREQVGLTTGANIRNGLLDALLDDALAPAENPWKWSVETQADIQCYRQPNFKGKGSALP
jgi:hypothetical protein